MLRGDDLSTWEPREGWTLPRSPSPRPGCTWAQSEQHQSLSPSLWPKWAYHVLPGQGLPCSLETLLGA